jgi:hypothetical protein
MSEPTVKQPPPSTEKLIEAARLQARMAGCVCSPRIYLRELSPQVYSAEVSHDSRCPLVGERGET